MRYRLTGFEVPRALCSHATLRESPCRPVTGVTHLTAVSELTMCYFDGRLRGEQLPRAVLPSGAGARRLKPARSREQILTVWGLGSRDVDVSNLVRQSEEKNRLVGPGPGCLGGAARLLWHLLRLRADRRPLQRGHATVVPPAHPRPVLDVPADSPGSATCCTDWMSWSWPSSRGFQSDAPSKYSVHRRTIAETVKWLRATIIARWTT